MAGGEHAMDTLIDLTHQIDNGMPVYPDDVPVTLRKIKTFEKDGYNNHRVAIGMHAGTHIDGPMHLTDSNTFISEVPLERCVGSGVLLDVRNETVITLKDKYVNRIAPDTIVLFYTGHDSFFGSETYYSAYPMLDEQAAQVLVDKKVKMVGFDAPSPDREPYPVHTLFLTNNILILENLTNLDALLAYTYFEVIALPLSIRADSSFLRVVARIEE